MKIKGDEKRKTQTREFLNIILYSKNSHKIFNKFLISFYSSINLFYLVCFRVLKTFKMNLESAVKFKLEDETTKSSPIIAAAKPLLKNDITIISANVAQFQSVPQTITTNNQPFTSTIQKAVNPNDELARRFRSETVRKNWQTVLDLALKKRSDIDFLDRCESVGLSGISQNQPSQEIYASEKENWIYFSIIIATVIILSILFCYLVYSFFPTLRANNF